MSLGVYQDQEWRKPKGPKTPPYHGNKWRATPGRVVEANNHRSPQENECGYCTTDRWGEGTRCLGRDPFLLLGTIWFGEGNHFAHSLGRRIISNNFFPLTTGRTFIFCLWHDGIWMRKIDGEVLRKKTWWRERTRKFFWTNDGKGNSLSTNENKGDVKGCNGLAVKRSIVLMKQRLCFKITAKLGNSNRQHYSR